MFIYSKSFAPIYYVWKCSNENCGKTNENSVSECAYCGTKK